MKEHRQQNKEKAARGLSHLRLSNSLHESQFQRFRGNSHNFGSSDSLAFMPSLGQSSPTVMRSPASGLAVNEPGDRYEQEASWVADRVMGMPAHVSVPWRAAASSNQKVQRTCAQCEEEEKGKLHRKETGAGPATAPPLVHEVLRSPGQPLDPGARAFMEPRFGHDFGSVRVHTDAKAATSARAVSASAYTVGNHMVFDHSRLDFGSQSGRRLLAHELTHVVQQSGTGAAPRLSRAPADAEPQQKKPAKKPKAPKCDTGCAQRWGQDTTCSKWGFMESLREKTTDKEWKSFPCCNSWPLSVENFARGQLGINGAASCTARHEKEIATVSWGDNEVQVLCSDTIPGAMFGGTANAKDCQ